ncbi:hypothetical protein FHV99_002641 [Ochrobactrum sp. P20RRXII]|nr:IS110 family transposase [Ochrobactrum sp. P20RRXII]NIH75419.1 hypothetical protein [Ochrobactrum sp. P20RRXII]
MSGDESGSTICMVPLILIMAGELVAWLGLAPRQFSTGGKPRLLPRDMHHNVVLVALAIKRQTARTIRYTMVGKYN